eukprot:1995049-Ditylum_brightwellii.AAC.1
MQVVWKQTLSVGENCSHHWMNCTLIQYQMNMESLMMYFLPYDDENSNVCTPALRSAKTVLQAVK